MPSSQVTSGAAITAAKANEITVGTTAPSTPTTGWIWIDTSTTNPVIKVWNGTSWLGSSGDAAFEAFMGEFSIGIG